MVDFESGKVIAGAATVTTAALMPPPTMTMTGADFALQVPPDSSFFLIAAAQPDHRTTYNPATMVKTMPLEHLQAATLSEAYLTKLADGFGVTPTAGSATVLVRAVDANGAALANVDGTMLTLGAAAAGAKGPFFLDPKLQPQAGAKATSASGYLVYFDVAPGTLQLAAGAGFTVQADATPTVANAVSLVDALVTKGTASAPPSNVSFQQQVMPIFISRGCYNCHSGNGDGRRLGDLVLDGAPQKVWAALTQTVSPNFGVIRVNLQAPEKSLLLTMPSYEVPPDPHPTVVFLSNADVDYQTILTWIKEGAKLN